MGYGSGKYKEIRQNINDKAKTDVCHQTARETHKCTLVEHIWY